MDTYENMDKTSAVVYLEDLEKPATASKENVVAVKTTTTAITDDEPTTTQKTSVKATKTATGATKRQRSLMDMFSSPSAGSSTKTSKVAKTDTPALNAIPFSMSEYQSGMKDEEKNLLALECETMGKSW